MRKATSLLLAILFLICTLTACGSNDQAAAADTYLSMAEDFIEQGNNEAAINILQKGFQETKDERIAVKMAELSANQPASTTTTDPTIDESIDTTASSAEVDVLSAYVGTWADDEDFGWEYGGYMLDILDASNGKFELTYSCIQGAPASRIAEFTCLVSNSDVINNELTVNFENDGWDNTGTATFTFSEKGINCLISDVRCLSDVCPIWGVYDGEFFLIRQDDAHEKLVYDLDEYYENYYEEGNYENSTDSMSFEQLVNSSKMLEWFSGDFVSNTKLNPVEAQYIHEKSEYINQTFVPCETKCYYVVCPRCLGSCYIDTYSGAEPCKNTGHDQKDKIENGVHYILEASLEEAVLKPITIKKVYTDPNGSTVYKTYCGWKSATRQANIYDARADQSIAITEDTEFIPCLVYQGTIDGVLQFSMIACEIVG